MHRLKTVVFFHLSIHFLTRFVGETQAKKTTETLKEHSNSTQKD